jgi:3-hydroxyacyl-CoA dehydrogenase
LLRGYSSTHKTVSEFTESKVLFHLVKEMGLTILEEVDKLIEFSTVDLSRLPFRTVDVVGLDTLVHVANGNLRITAQR